MSDEDKSEPLAQRRTRRSNAGARMHEMIFAAEDDEQLAQAYGLLKADDDSSEDEEYIPKDLESGSKGNAGGDEAGGGDDDDDDDASQSDDDSNSDDSSDEDDDDDEEDDEEEEDEEGEDGGEKEVKEENDNNDHQQQQQQRKRLISSGESRKQNSTCDDSTSFNAKKLLQSPNKTKLPITSTSATTTPGSPTKAAYDSCRKICSVCLGDQSNEDDEIIECDSCGVSVHEACYGVLGENHDSATVGNNNDNANENCDDESKQDENDNTSNHSNISSESTEPWFCEPCRRSVKNPLCELCPNTGGIFKQTDTGRWIHMVCALYTRGVTFENVDCLSQVSLFELNYALYGSKACTICEDRRLARSGICIGCDAGLCKTFFHVTCAQKEGLLFESHADDVDPYFAQCKQHADKTIIKKKKRTYTALFARLRRVQPSQQLSERIKKKLAEITQQPDPHLTRWKPDNRPPIPIRVGRMLMTSPSLIMRLTKKSELMGLDPKSAFMSVQDEMEMARQKWHIPPAFNLEFVAYCRDRTTRMVSMKKQNVELIDQNKTLKNEEANLREKYNSIKELVVKLRSESDNLIKEARAIQKLVTASSGKQFNLPAQMEQLVARYTNIKGKNQTNKANSHNATTNKTSSTYGCGKCKTVKDQHLLALCDTCNAYFHIYCLDPPLTRVPKKTKFGGWQCSDCSERDEEKQEALEEQNILAMQEAAQEEEPRRLRERIKYPEKYCHESMLMADFWSTHKKKSKKSSKGGGGGNKSKKVKVELI